MEITLVCGILVSGDEVGYIKKEDPYQFVEAYNEEVLGGTGLVMRILPHDQSNEDDDSRGTVFVIGYELSTAERSRMGLSSSRPKNGSKIDGVDITEISQAFGDLSKLPTNLQSKKKALYLIPDRCSCCT